MSEELKKITEQIAAYRVDPANKVDVGTAAHTLQAITDTGKAALDDSKTVTLKDMEAMTSIMLNLVPKVPHPTEPGTFISYLDGQALGELVYSAILLGIGLSIQEEIR